MCVCALKKSWLRCVWLSTGVTGAWTHLHKRGAALESMSERYQEKTVLSLQ